MKNILSITLMILSILSISSCKKAADSVTQNNIAAAKNKNLKDVSADYKNYNNYLRIFALGSLDLIKSSEFQSLVVKAAQTTNGNSDPATDYYAYLSDVAALYNNANRNLITDMEKSILNNGGTQTDVNLFNKYTYTYTTGNYSFNMRYFLPYLNTNYYTVNQTGLPDVGIILTYLNADGTFTGWKGATAYSAASLSYSDIESQYMFLISSSIAVNSVGTGTKPYEMCGKCTKSSTTGWCNNDGHGCKCDGGPVTIQNQITALSQLIQ